MKYINTLQENTRISSVYLCRSKSTHLTKTGKEYESLTLQDRTGTADAKIWDPSNPGIGDFDAPDYVAVDADVQTFNGNIQLIIRRIRRAEPGEYAPEDYLPVSERSREVMFQELKAAVASVKDPFYAEVLKKVFFTDVEFTKRFCARSAAKSVHHSFVGGLLEHTLSVTKLCDYYCSAYPILNRDLLITAALCHDIGKVQELSAFPENEYTDEGQLLGHIVMGSEMLAKIISEIPDYPPRKAAELRHCILAHHGEYEFGSPKKPALMEAMALNMADNTDAKMEIFKELLTNAGTAGNNGWLGFQRFLDSNVRRASE